MAKLTLNNLANLQNETTAVSTVNFNNDAIEAALEKTLSRDGTSPNSMSANIDMNSNRIINLPLPVGDTEPARLIDVRDGITGPAGANGVDGATGPVAWSTPSAWLTATTYAVGPPASVVTESGSTYVCIVAHTSGTFATDLAASKWLLIAQKGADGAGTGDFSSNTASSVDGEVVVFSGTAGKTGKRATGTGLAVLTSGVLSASTTSTAATLGTIELGAASDTTISRSSAGVIAVEGVTVSLNSTSSVHTASTIELGNASDTTLSRSAAGILAVEGVNVLTTGTGAAQGKQTIFIPAAAMLSRTTNGPSVGLVELSTNKIMVRSLDFDATTQEFAQFSVWFPKSWNLGTVTFQPCFSQLTTAAGGVVFGLAGVAISDTDDLDAAPGTAQTSTKTAGTLNKEYQGPESAAITIAGTPTAGDRVLFQINRTVADASDTLAQDARLHGIRLFFTTNASTDA